MTTEELTESRKNPYGHLIRNEYYSVYTDYDVEDSYRPPDWDVMLGCQLKSHLESIDYYNENGIDGESWQLSRVTYSVATDSEFRRYEMITRCPDGY